MNRGDSRKIPLTILIDNEPITEGYADEIELTFNSDLSKNCVRKKLSTEDIFWDSESSKYAIQLSQADTFKLKVGLNTYQFRVLKDDEVISSITQPFYLGSSNSSEVLNDGSDENEPANQ